MPSSPSKGAATKTAVVAGATGLVGSALLRILLDDSQYTRVLSLGRRSSGIVHPKLREHRVDFDQLPLLETLTSTEPITEPLQVAPLRIDDVFCALGTTIKVAGSQEAFTRVDYHYPLALARWAQLHGAQQFLMVSALGANPASRVFYNRVKGQAEASIQALSLARTVFARPSLLLGARPEHRFAESLGQALTPLFRFLLHGPLKKYRPIQAEHVAHALHTLAQEDVPGLHIVESDRLQSLCPVD